MARWFRRRYALKRRVNLPRIPKLLLVFLLVFFLSIYMFRMLDKNLKPAIIQMAEARAHQVAGEAIHKALYDKVLANVNYNDLVFVHKDSQQRITMMQANSIKISRIISQANLEIKQSLRNISEETLKIPLGQASGSRILANYGPRINVRIIPLGTVSTKFADEFQQAGINQVRHILYLKIETTVRIVFPLAATSIEINNNIPMAETIIVGEVPKTYVGLESLFKGIVGAQPGQ